MHRKGGKFDTSFLNSEKSAPPSLLLRPRGKTVRRHEVSWQSVMLSAATSKPSTLPNFRGHRFVVARSNSLSASNHCNLCSSRHDLPSTTSTNINPLETALFSRRAPIARRRWHRIFKMLRWRSAANPDERGRSAAGNVWVSLVMLLVKSEIVALALLESLELTTDTNCPNDALVCWASDNCLRRPNL